MSEDKKNPNAKELKRMRDRFELCQTAERDIRDKALEDLKFYSGDQWPSDIVARRKGRKKPMLTINRMPQFVHQVTNTQRMNKTMAAVHPVDSGGDVDTADVIQGLLRHIWYDSDADIAVGTAGFYGACIGFGVFYVDWEFCNPLGFERDLKIKRARNPFAFSFDPDAPSPHAADGQFAFGPIEDFKDDEFKEEFPDAKLTNADKGDWTQIGNSCPGWIEGKKVRVARYYFRDNTRDTLLLLKDGSTALKSEYQGNEDAIVNERATEIPVIRAWKTNGYEVLEETTVPGSGKLLPVFRVVGEELDINGELKLSGIVRNAKDPQRQYNYMASEETEAISLVPKTHWRAGVGTIEGFEKDYQRANHESMILKYTPKSVNGVLVPPPEIVSVNPAVQAATNARINAGLDMEACTGIYRAQLGAPSPERSGKAIDSRKEQGETGNYHYVDNLHIAITASTRFLVDAIPYVYDTPRTIRILGEDDAAKIVQVNQAFEEGGKDKTYNLRDAVGKYDVVCSTSPSFETKRQQAAESIMQMVSAYPALMQIAGDLLFKVLDTPYAQELADRFKKTLPPELQDKEEGEQDIPPAIKQKFTALLQQHEVMTQQLNQAKEALATKQVENSTKIEIVKLQERTKLIVAALAAQSKMDAQLAVTEAEKELAILENEHDAHMTSFEQQHEHDMADKSHAQGLEQADQVAVNQAALAEQSAAQQGAGV